MPAPQLRTLCVRPALAAAGRWSIDAWLDASPLAAYQGPLETFATREEASQAAPYIKASLESKGETVTILNHEKNSTRDRIPPIVESEEDLRKHLQKYVESAFEPMRKFSPASFFEWKNWVKSFNALTGRSPLLLSILTLVSVLFQSRVEGFLTAILPDKVEFLAPEMLKAAPVFLLLSTLFVHYASGKLSLELDRVRQWILLLAIQYHWDLERFMALMRAEFAQLDYAAQANRVFRHEKKFPASFSNLVSHLAQRMGPNSPEAAESIVRGILRDDFARKIQALAGLAGELDYDPAGLALYPLHLLLSIESVNIILLGLLGATPDRSSGMAGVASSRRYHDGIAVRVALIGAGVIVAIVSAALILSTLLALKTQPWLFVVDVLASLGTLALLLRRAFAILVRRRYLPRGLELFEIGSSLKLHIA